MSRYEVTSEAEHFPIRKDPLIFFPLSQHDESCHLCKDSETTLWRDPRGVTVSSQQPWGEGSSRCFSREPSAAQFIAASLVCVSDASHLGTGRCWSRCPSRGRLTPRDGKCLGLFQLLWHNVTDRALMNHRNRFLAGPEVRSPRSRSQQTRGACLDLPSLVPVAGLTLMTPQTLQP